MRPDTILSQLSIILTSSALAEEEEERTDLQMMKNIFINNKYYTYVADLSAFKLEVANDTENYDTRRQYIV